MAGKSGILVTSNRLGEMARKCPELTSQIIGKVTFDLEAQIKQNIVAVGAVDTGNMLNSTQGHHAPGSHEGYVDTAADYWEHVNYGTVNVPARPFVQPAVDRIQPSLEAAVKAGLERL